MSPQTPSPPNPIVVSLISLGCSKNTVDSEHILAHLAKNGFAIAEDPQDADIYLVNTCGFIEEARLETAETLQKLRALTNDAPQKVLIALGCMVERARQSPEMAKFLEAADGVVSFAEYPRLPEICRRIAANTRRKRHIPNSSHATTPRLHAPPPAFLDFLRTPRLRIGAPHTAYLKISEGCSNHCRFCSIPLIRGRQVSRPMSDILSEAQQLVSSGAREINLIAQDTTSYGRDLGISHGLHSLLTALVRKNAQVWYRVLYAHPAHLSESLLHKIAHTPAICPYLDLPLQHISDRMLRAMGRGMTRDQTWRWIEKIRKIMPEGALRTTFIVGFPGETERDFAELEHFVEQGFFTHVGVFTYSAEPNTPAAQTPDDVPADVKENRRAALMSAQQVVRSKQLQNFAGRIMEVMVDQIANGKFTFAVPRGSWAIGRSRLDAPEVDGVVFITGKRRRCAPGDRISVRIIRSLDYDLVAEATTL